MTGDRTIPDQSETKQSSLADISPDTCSEGAETSIDVDAIVREIRSQIELESGMEDIPPFEGASQGFTGKENKVKRFLGWRYMDEHLEYLNEHFDVKYYREIPGNFIKRFPKKLVRKLIKPVMLPVVTEQELVNAHSADAISKLQEETSFLLMQYTRAWQEIQELRGIVKRQQEQIEELRCK